MLLLLTLTDYVILLFMCFRGQTLRSRNHRQVIGAPSVAETEMFSTVGTEDMDDEFYDFSSDNET